MTRVTVTGTSDDRAMTRVTVMKSRGGTISPCRSQARDDEGRRRPHRSQARDDEGLRRPHRSQARDDEGLRRPHRIDAVVQDTEFVDVELQQVLGELKHINISAWPDCLAHAQAIMTSLPTIYFRT